MSPIIHKHKIWHFRINSWTRNIATKLNFTSRTTGNPIRIEIIYHSYRNKSYFSQFRFQPLNDPIIIASFRTCKTCCIDFGYSDSAFHTLRWIPYTCQITLDKLSFGNILIIHKKTFLSSNILKKLKIHSRTSSLHC